MISYYELLGMIKEHKAPDKVMYDGNIYQWSGSNYLNNDSHVYITEYLCEVRMFDKNIKIIEGNKIKKLDIPNQQVTIANHYSKDNIQCIVNEFYRRFSVLINKQNEIIEVLNEKEKVQDNQK